LPAPGGPPSSLLQFHTSLAVSMFAAHVVSQFEFPLPTNANHATGAAGMRPT